MLLPRKHTVVLVSCARIHDHDLPSSCVEKLTYIYIYIHILLHQSVTSSQKKRKKTQMGREISSWLVLSGGRLKKAVKKLTFLIRLNLRRWRLHSILGSTSNRVRRRRLRFNDRRGLLGRCIEVIDEDEKSIGNCSVIGIQQATCFASDDDIDSRAEIFIADFRLHLLLESQVSLE